MYHLHYLAWSPNFYVHEYCPVDVISMIYFIIAVHVYLCICIVLLYICAFYTTDKSALTSIKTLKTYIYTCNYNLWQTYTLLNCIIMNLIFRIENCYMEHNTSDVHYAHQGYISQTHQWKYSYNRKVIMLSKRIWYFCCRINRPFLQEINRIQWHDKNNLN